MNLVTPSTRPPCSVPEPAGFGDQHDSNATVTQTFRTPSGVLISISLQCSPARVRAAAMASGFAVAAAMRAIQIGMPEIPPPDVDPEAIMSRLEGLL